MKRALIAAAVIGAVFVGYRTIRGHGPEAHYQAFAEEILHRRYAAAAGMAEGLTERDLEKLGSQERIGAGPQMFQTLFPSRFRIESKDSGSDGTVIVHATQTVLFNPVGVESAVRPAMFATLKQVTTLRKSADGWKVVRFENQFEKMDSMSGR
ncbi:MAG TPA: hypothetical protein VF787_22445 [Thermoanaerobaculia bacterium]